MEPLAVQDRVFRAFDIKTGKTLWETRLPTTAQGYPTTFSVGGDQFVAVPTGYNGGSPEQKPTTMLRGEIVYDNGTIAGSPAGHLLSHQT